MIKNITIKSVRIADKKSDGTEYVNKSGQKFWMAFLETECHISATKYLDSKFGIKDKEIIEKWQVGDNVTVVIEKVGDFTNFNVPKKTDLLEERITVLENRMNKMAKLWAEQHRNTPTSSLNEKDNLATENDFIFD